MQFIPQNRAIEAALSHRRDEGAKIKVMKKMVEKGWARVAESRAPGGYIDPMVIDPGSLILIARTKKSDRISLRDDLFEASRADAVGVFFGGNFARIFSTLTAVSAVEVDLLSSSR